MNPVTEDAKNGAIKTLAIVGFIVMIIIAVWLAVTIVRFLPTAFVQLADLAEDLQNGKDTIVLEKEVIVSNTGETVVINYTNNNTDGDYTFTYACVDGVAVAFINDDESKEFIACDEAVELKSGSPLTLVVSSEKERTIDLAYTIRFAPTTGEPVYASTGKLTVVNANIPVGGTVAVVTPEPEEEEEPVVVKPTPTPVKPQPVLATPVTTIKYVTQIPQSDPNGFTDLAIAFISPTTIEAEDDATIKIEVKNIGTKTSKEFDLVIELPTGEEYEAKNEKGLKPNERAVYTIEFDAEDLDRTETVKGEVSVSSDTISKNDSFRTTLRIND